MKSNVKKNQLGIRIPYDLDKLLEERVKKIGISKTAYILTLIYNALEKIEQPPKIDNKELE